MSAVDREDRMFASEMVLAVLMIAPAVAGANDRQVPPSAGAGAIAISCRYADFEFAGEGGTVDVDDRHFSEEPLTTVANLAASPKTYVIAWERRMSTAVGPRRLQYQYRINRKTGQATVQSSDQTAGIPPLSYESDEDCRISH